MDIRLAIPKSILMVLNQLYEIEQKIHKQGDPSSLSRNVGKMRDALSEEGLPIGDGIGGEARVCLFYEDPMGQGFNETRTDVEATIAGSGTENLVVVEVIKPIIRAVMRNGEGECSRIVQRAIVIVESRKEQ